MASELNPSSNGNYLLLVPTAEKMYRNYETYIKTLDIRIQNEITPDFQVCMNLMNNHTSESDIYELKDRLTSLGETIESAEETLKNLPLLEEMIRSKFRFLGAILKKEEYQNSLSDVEKDDIARQKKMFKTCDLRIRDIGFMHDLLQQYCHKVMENPKGS